MQHFKYAVPPPARQEDLEAQLMKTRKQQRERKVKNLLGQFKYYENVQRFSNSPYRVTFSLQDDQVYYEGRLESLGSRNFVWVSQVTKFSLKRRVFESLGQHVFKVSEISLIKFTPMFPNRKPDINGPPQ